MLAVESDLPGHEVVLRRLAGHDRRPSARGDRPPPLRRRRRPRSGRSSAPDASAIDSSKARRLLGWEPKRSWRDYLDDQGKLRKARPRRGEQTARLAGARDLARSASARWAARRAVEVRLGAGRRRRIDRRDPAGGRPGRQLDRHGAVYGLGHAEEVVGRALEPYRVGEDVLVFTKCGRTWDGRPRSTSTCARSRSGASARQSLRRLGVERIDLYQFHWPDYGTGTPVEDSWGTMGELVDEGKVRWLGVCNFDVDAARALRGRPARRLAAAAALAAQPLRPARPAPVGARARDGRDRLLAAWRPGCSPARSTASGSSSSPRTTRRRAPAVPGAGAVAEPRARRADARRSPSGSGTVAALAVAWVLAVPGVTGAIVGARRPAQVDDWLGRRRPRARRPTCWPRSSSRSRRPAQARTSLLSRRRSQSS